MQKQKCFVNTDAPSCIKESSWRSAEFPTLSRNCYTPQCTKVHFPGNAPRQCGRIYLDNAGASIAPASLILAVSRLTGQIAGVPNPHSSGASHAKVAFVCNSILGYFGAKQYSLIFTAGATSALELLGRFFQWEEGSIYFYPEDAHSALVGVRQYSRAANSDASRDATQWRSYFSYDAYGDILDSSPSHNWSNLVDPTYISQELSDTATHLIAVVPENNIDGAYCVSPERLPQLLSALKSNPRVKVCTLLDLSKFAASHPVDLDSYDADFAVLSFYKLFGLPTGLGALFVRHSAAVHLKEGFLEYFGGGSVSLWSPFSDFLIPRPALSDRLTFGTPHFHGILSLPLCFKYSFRLPHETHGPVPEVEDEEEKEYLRFCEGSSGTWTRRLGQIVAKWSQECRLRVSISHERVVHLAEYLSNKLHLLYHPNGFAVVEMYAVAKSTRVSSTVILFNCQTSNRVPVAPKFLAALAEAAGIHLRDGCFCNIGGCMRALEYTEDVLQELQEQGFGCGGRTGLHNGKLISCCRASLGHYNTRHDIDCLVRFIYGAAQYFGHLYTAPRCFFKQNYLPPHDGALVGLYVFPVKSCAGISLSKNAGTAGLEGQAGSTTDGTIDANRSTRLRKAEAPFGWLFDTQKSCLLWDREFRIESRTTPKSRGLARRLLNQVQCSLILIGFSCGDSRGKRETPTDHQWSPLVHLLLAAPSCRPIILNLCKKEDATPAESLFCQNFLPRSYRNRFRSKVAQVLEGSCNLSCLPKGSGDDGDRDCQSGSREICGYDEIYTGSPFHYFDTDADFRKAMSLRESEVRYIKPGERVLLPMDWAAFFENECFVVRSSRSVQHGKTQQWENRAEEYCRRGDQQQEKPRFSNQSDVLVVDETDIQQLRTTLNCPDLSLQRFRPNMLIRRAVVAGAAPLFVGARVVFADWSFGHMKTFCCIKLTHKCRRCGAVNIAPVSEEVEKNKAEFGKSAKILHLLASMQNKDVPVFGWNGSILDRESQNGDGVVLRLGMPFFVDKNR